MTNKPKIHLTFKEVNTIFNALRSLVNEQSDSISHQRLLNKLLKYEKLVKEKKKKKLIILEARVLTEEVFVDILKNGVGEWKKKKGVWKRIK